MKSIYIYIYKVRRRKGEEKRKIQQKKKRRNARAREMEDHKRTWDDVGALTKLGLYVVRTSKLFQGYDGLIFLCDTGICVCRCDDGVNWRKRVISFFKIKK